MTTAAGEVCDLCEVVLGQVQLGQVGQALQLGADGGDVVALQQQHLKQTSEQVHGSIRAGSVTRPVTESGGRGERT